MEAHWLQALPYQGQKTHRSHMTFCFFGGFFLNVILSAKEGYSHPAYSCLFCSLEQKNKTKQPPRKSLGLELPGKPPWKWDWCKSKHFIWRKKKAAIWKTGKRRSGEKTKNDNKLREKRGKKTVKRREGEGVAARIYSLSLRSLSRRRLDTDILFFFFYIYIKTWLKEFNILSVSNVSHILEQIMSH